LFSWVLCSSRLGAPWRSGGDVAKNSFHIQENWRRQDFEFFFVRREWNGGHLSSKEVAKVEWGPMPESQEVEPTPYPLEREEVQAMFDQLWRLGFRPAANSVAEFNATSKHLEDLRAIVFEKLKVKKP
jgi:hypothetical protein